MLLLTQNPAELRLEIRVRRNIDDKSLGKLLLINYCLTSESEGRHKFIMSSKEEFHDRIENEWIKVR